MENRVIQLVQQVKDEQCKPRDEAKESDVDHGARLALEDEWIGGLYYKGNSVSWSHSKAKRYSDDLMKAWAALAEIGVHSDGQTHIADVIRRLKVTPDQVNPETCICDVPGCRRYPPSTIIADEGKTMAIDEELLKPSREHLANLRAQISALEAETHEKIKRYGEGYARKLWQEFHLAVEPLLREQEAVTKLITDYYALQPMPPQIVCRPSTPPDTPPRTAAGTHTPA